MSRPNDLLTTITTLLRASLADSTQASYEASWELFQTFLSSSGLRSSLPVQSHLICLFVAFLYQRNYAAASIRTHLSALAYPHNLLGLKDPTGSFLVSKLLRGVSVLVPSEDVRLPITLDILKSLISVISQSSKSVFEAKLYKAMCCVAFYGFMRCSEICKGPHCLQLNQVKFFGFSHLTITMTSFKHNTAGKLFTLRLNSKPDVSDPVVNLDNYLELRGTHQGPLFCSPTGAAISPTTFRNRLKGYFAIMGLDSKQFKSHSFRIGAACHALTLGRTENEIQILGRWASPPALRKYLRVAGLHGL